MTDQQEALPPSPIHTKCAGCGGVIVNGDSVMRLTMDQFAEWQGLPPLGMDDLLAFTLCEGCTQQGDSPWEMEVYRG